MKKIKLFILSLGLILIFSACNSKNTQVMQLNKVEWTNQEENVIKLLDTVEVPHIFEFTVDETVNHIVVNCYELDKSGEWKLINGSGGQRLDSKNGRIALGFNVIGNGINVMIQNKDNTNKVKYVSDKNINTNNMTIGTSFVNDATEIIYEKEIPLLIQVVTSKNGTVCYNVDYFFQPKEYLELDYEHVYAVTVVFSQKILNMQTN